MAANTIEVIQMIAREMLRILHNQLNFISNINHSYDKEYNDQGAEIGSQLKIRLPNQYTVGTGRVITPQGTDEDVVTIVRATQKHVAVDFTSEELTQHINDSGVRERVIRPAMATLASHVEADVFNMVKDVYHSVGAAGTTPAAMSTILDAHRKLDEFLAPKIDRCLILNPDGEATMLAHLSSLFQHAGAVGKQYLTGRMRHALGFDWYSNPLIPVLTTGTRDNTTPVINGGSQQGTSLILNGLNPTGGTIEKGALFTIADVYAVHPETKTAYEYLKQFTVSTAVTASGGDVTLSIQPAIITSGAKQTVDAVPVHGAAITFNPANASTNYPMNIAFHKEAFAFVGAKMKTYKDAHICHQETIDGLSIRLWSASDIMNDRLITRIDILYGYKCVRPELACRIWG